MRYASLLILFTWVHTACGADRSAALADDWVAAIDTAGDTISVHTLSGGAWGAASLEEELRIGALDGEEHETFGRLAAIAVAGDGEILVYDAQAVALRRFDARGRYLGTIGRSGDGPGEYRGVVGVAAIADGRIVAFDGGNMRYNVYAPDGAPLDTWTGLRHAVVLHRPLFAAPTGGIFHFVPIGAQPSPRLHGVLVALDANGQPRDTVRIPTPPAETPVIARPGGVAGFLLPFAPRFDWSVTPDGAVVSGYGDRYAIDVHRRDGSVLRLSRAAEPVPVSAAERAAEEERITTLMRRTDPGWRWSGPAIPARKPSFVALHAGRDGRIWVERAGRGEPLAAAERRPGAGRWVREAVAFDVFEANGRYLGSIDAPPGFLTAPRPVFRGQHVWAVVQDAYGVQYVVRYRVRATR